MSRKILCSDCNKELSLLAKHYKELYESVEGTAKHAMICDDCGIDILPKQKCFASVLLDNNQHPNYKFQKPSIWMNEYINEVKPVL